MITFALDRSARTFDEDGRLRVALTPISKAAVNPYYGKEIPNYGALGLDPGRVYNLLRDPEELKKAAATFNGVQLLDTHIPVSAANPRDQQTVGAIGTDTAFDAPYLKASLIVWDAEAIKRIESGEQRQLSSGYRYDPDMTPGAYEGQPYDGVMRNIRGNHVALVETGRAGPDVMVGDQALNTETRDDLDDDKFAVPSKRKLPIENEKHIRLAWDLLDDTEGLTSEEKAHARTRILHAAREHDMDVSDWKGATDAAPNSPTPKGKQMAASKRARLDARLEILKPFMAQDADLEKLRAALAIDAEKDDEKKPVEDDDDETEEERKKREAEGGRKANAERDAEDDEDDDDEEDKKAAMDAAISAAVAKARAEARADHVALDKAIRDVRPLVGEVIGMDSAEAVYKFALEQTGGVRAAVPAAAYQDIIAERINARSAKPATVAMDGATHKNFTERFPNAARVKVS